MEDGRNSWWAAIRLAITLSVLATAAAIVLHTLGDVSQTAIVLGVIVVGFGTSWVQTGRLARRRTPAPRGHRIVTLQSRGVRFPVS